MSNARHMEKGLHWKWVLFSTLAGLLFVGASYFVIAPVFKSIDVQALVMLVGFIAAGAVIGFFSPGVTIKEAGLGGLLVSLIILTAISIGKPSEPAFSTVATPRMTAESTTTATVEPRAQFSGVENLVMLALGVMFSLVGGWVGEKLQGDESKEYEKHAKHFLWKWVVIGVIVGFALNILFVFLLAPMLRINLSLLLIAFMVSFVAAGFIVGFKSPGRTIKEPAVAGLFVVLLDWIFLEFVISLHAGMPNLVGGLSIGFLFTLLGAWMGERVQERQDQVTSH
jgi:hypothetical protein